MFSVLVSVSAMTDQALADSGNISDAVTTSVVPAINWVEMPEISPEVSAAVDLSSTASTPTTTTPSGSESTAPSGEGATAPSFEATAPEKSADDMDMKSERMRKVGSPRF